MLRTASAALLMALTLGAAHAASPDDGMVPPGSVGSDQASQGQYLQNDDQGGYDQGQGGQYQDGQAQDGQGQYDQRQQYGQQQYGQPVDNQRQTYQPPSRSQGSYAVAQSDSQVGELLVRVQRLEGDNRRLNGTVDDLQGQIRKLQDDIKRAQDDTEYRLQALEGGGKGGAAPAPRIAPQSPANQPPRQRTELAPSRQQNDPAAPPRQLGTLPGNSQADAGGQDQMDDQNGDDGQAPAQPAPRRQMNSSTITPGLPGVAVDTSRPLASNEPAAGAPPAPSAPATAEDEYNNDYRLISSQKYDEAEAAFRGFVASHPRDKRVPDAIHWIGESLYQRRQYSDAAEQFIKVTKTYANSRRAPSSMLKLGMSLAAMGEKDAACATLLELPRKYPKAGASLLSGAGREAKRNNCPAT